MKSNLLDDLDDNQKEVVTTFPGPICVMAGAGTGKTRAITYRIAYAVQEGIYRAENVLALTFTTKAAVEMQERLAQLGVKNVQARTFHAAAYRQLAYFWPIEMGYELPRLHENKFSIMSALANKLNIKLDKASMRDLSAEIEWAKVSVIPTSEYAEYATSVGRQIPCGKTAQEMQTIFETYEEVKTEMGGIDFEDVFILLIGLYKSFPYLLDQVHKQYKYFIVDEYQDVSLLQQLILDLWVKDPKNLCVVGDTAQTIYSFAGANPSFLLDFTTKYDDAVRIILDRNYRSGTKIIHLANNLIKSAKHKGKKLFSVELFPVKTSDNSVEYKTYVDDETEAENVAIKIESLIKQGVNPNSIAILYRTNIQSQFFENSLSSRNIPFLVKNNTKFFSRTEIREAISIFRKIAQVSPKEDSVTVVENVLSNMGWKVDADNLTGSSKDRWDSLNALRNLSIKQKALFPCILEFYNYLSDRCLASVEVEIEGVVLSSLHSCKGLEWDYVFLVGMQEGFMPISLAKTDDEIEEERRLLYVGITRAREQLYISNVLPKATVKQNKDRLTYGEKNISKFLLPYWYEKDVTQKNDFTRLSANKINKTDNILDDYSEETKYLHDLLIKWRKSLAQDLSVPENKIIKDSSLLAVAIAKPKTIRQMEIIRGVNKSFTFNYGKEILRIIKDNS